MSREEAATASVSAGAEPSTPPGEPLPRQLLWLADAPLFIDEKQVDALYDAILQPDYEEVSRNINRSFSKETKVGANVTVGAAFPWLAKGEVQGSLDHAKGSAEEQGSTWNRVANPYRHLLLLALQYMTQESLLDRLVFANGDGCTSADGDPVRLDDLEYSRRSPRAMVMFDFPSGTKFIPAALELTDGSVKTTFLTLAKRLEKNASEPLPEYRSGADPASVKARHDYWSWFERFYDRQEALQVVEEAVKGAPIAWIAYRVPILGLFPHLHLAGRGRYDTGTFGYQLLARGERHGLRVVGTLKSEPDLNVLAVFER